MDGASGFLPAWQEIKRLISVNARHRKGFSLNAPSLTEMFIISQAKDELEELRVAEYYAERPTGDSIDRTKVLEELADVIGVLFHFGIRCGFTPEQITATMLTKFGQRFTEEPTP